MANISIIRWDLAGNRKTICTTDHLKSGDYEILTARYAYRADAKFTERDTKEEERRGECRYLAFANG